MKPVLLRFAFAQNLNSRSLKKLQLPVRQSDRTIGFTEVRDKPVVTSKPRAELGRANRYRLNRHPELEAVSNSKSVLNQSRLYGLRGNILLSDAF